MTSSRLFAAALAVLLVLVVVCCIPSQGSRERVIPRRVDTCTAAQDVLLCERTDMMSRIDSITPWSPDSQIRPMVAALTAGAREINPLTRIGVTDRVLRFAESDNPCAGDDDISASPCSSAPSVYEVQPFQPGFLVKAQNDSTDGTMAQRRYHYQPAYWSRTSGPYGGPYHPVASCPEDLGLDCDFVADGSYETMVASGEAKRESQQDWVGEKNERDLAEVSGLSTGAFASTASRAVRRQAAAVELRRRQAAAKETLRSRNHIRAVALNDQCLTGAGCGLGSTWIDPRFEPGPQEMYYGGDAHWAHGGHAGGPTFGSFTPAVFQTSGTWNRNVHGFGDGDYVAPTGQ